MGLISYVDGPEIPPKDKKTENPLVISKYNGIKIPKCKDDTKTFKTMLTVIIFISTSLCNLSRGVY